MLGHMLNKMAVSEIYSENVIYGREDLSGIWRRGGGIYAKSCVAEIWRRG